MAERVSFAIELKDDISASSKNAADALATLNLKIKEDVQAISEMRRAMRNLKGNTSVSAKAFTELRSKIDAQRASLASSQAKFVEMGGQFGKTGSKVQTATGSVSKMSDAMTMAGGQTAALAGGVGRLSALLANPVTLMVALTGATLAFAAAVVVATSKLTKFGFAMASLRRDEQLQIEGLQTLRRQYGRTTASVGAMQAAIDRASDSTNIGRQTLLGYARQMERAGLRGDALADAVEAMGIAAQVQGDRGVGRFRALAFQARLTGGSVVALAESYRQRLGPIARAQMLSLSNQTTRLRQNLSSLFSGLQIDGFLEAIAKSFDLFSKTSVTGKVLKGLFDRLLQPLIDGGAKAVSIFKPFIQGMILGFLKIENLVLRAALAIKQAFGDTSLFKNIRLDRIAVHLGELTAAGIVGAVVALGAALGTVAAVMVALAAPTIFFISQLVRLSGVVGTTMGKLRGLSFGEIANQMIDGLVQGLMDGIARVKSAVMSVAKAAKDTFTSALKISSPSKVFEGFGQNISQGVSQGVDSGQSQVDGSIQNLVQTPESAGVTAGARQSISVSIGDIHVDGGKAEGDPRQLAIAIRDELASILEGVSIEMGAV